MVHQKDTSQEVAGYFLLLFPGTLRTGAPSGTRTVCAGRFVSRTEKCPCGHF
jgi:hypothetical protein